MTRQEHLLTILAEECAEVAQRASKMLRFGADDVEPGQALPNHEQLAMELDHVFAMARMLADEGIIRPHHDQAAVRQKIVNVEKWLLHAKMQGTLTA